MQQHIVYLFEGFRLDVTRRKLLSAGGLVQPLNSRAMEALLVLVAHAGEVVPKRHLLQAVWPHTVVEDNNLNQCILAIRKALGETAGANRFVMTVPGRGFCFVCPVQRRIQESDETSRSQQPAIATRPTPARGIPQAVRCLVSQRSFWYGVATGGAVSAIAVLPVALR